VFLVLLFVVHLKAWLITIGTDPAGRLEGWKAGRLEGWKAGRLEGRWCGL